MRLYRDPRARWFRTAKDAGRGAVAVDVPTTTKDGMIEWLQAPTTAALVVPDGVTVETDGMTEARFTGFAEARFERAASGEVVAPPRSHYRSPFSAETTVQRIDAGMMAEAIKLIDDPKTVGRLTEALIERLQVLRGGE